jgi:hypothetical protein
MQPIGWKPSPTLPEVRGRILDFTAGTPRQQSTNPTLSSVHPWPVPWRKPRRPPRLVLRRLPKILLVMTLDASSKRKPRIQGIRTPSPFAHTREPTRGFLHTGLNLAGQTPSCLNLSQIIIRIVMSIFRQELDIENSSDHAPHCSIFFRMLCICIWEHP